jgi:transposase InsO family protein/transposase-like protein
MITRKKYPEELKLEVVKKCIEEEKSSVEVGNEYGINDSTIRQWVKKYREEGEDCFKEKVKVGSFIRDATKMPPTLYKKLGLDKIREDPKELKKALTEIEKYKLIVAEKELENMILRDALKKKDEVDYDYWIDYYSNFGIAISFLLRIMGKSKSTYYYKNEEKNTKKKKRKKRKYIGHCKMTNGRIVEDEWIRNKLHEIYSENNPLKPEYYVKLLGSVKMSAYFFDILGIIINHKKLHRLRKELGYVRRYRRRHTHPVRRSTQHKINSPGIIWEIDIKFIPTIEEGNVALLDIIDVYSKEIVGSYIGKSCTSKDVVRIISEAILYQESVPKIIRSDNGSQFKSICCREAVEELGIMHEFGIKHHPDSQAYIEAQHSNIQREFMALNIFKNAEDVFIKYQVYMYFYHYLRPHASLNYETPMAYKEKGNNSKIIIVKR